MSLVPLSEWVQDLESGARPKGGIRDGIGDIPSLGAEHLTDDGGFNFSKDKRIPRDFFRQMKKGKIYKNDILVVKDGATTGKVSFVSNAFPYQEAAINEHVFRIRVCDKKADPGFVFRFLQSPTGQAQIMSDFRGATVGGIGRTFVDKVLLPKIDRDEQRRIAAILDKADAIRRKRQQALALADDFLKSVFLEMFGDPETNPKQLPQEELGKLLERIDSGHSPKCEARPAAEDEIGILKVSSISSTQFKPEENKAVFEGYPIDERNLVHKGDLLFSRKNTYQLVGASAIVEHVQGKLALPDLIFRLVPTSDRKIEIPYLWMLLTQDSIRERLRKVAGGSAASMPNIGKERLRSVLLPIAKPVDQVQFTKYYSKRISLKKKLQDNLIVSEDLFASLSQRAFRGEL